MWPTAWVRPTIWCSGRTDGCVTDTRGEIDFFNPDDNMRGWVWAVDTDSGATELMLDSGPVFINGLGFTPDGSRLMVTATSSSQLLSYDTASLRQADGEVLCTFAKGRPDGMAVGQGGDMWVRGLTGSPRRPDRSAARQCSVAVRGAAHQRLFQRRAGRRAVRHHLVPSGVGANPALNGVGMQQKTIVITGASDGIGRVAAGQLSRHGHSVLVVGRSPEKTARVAARPAQISSRRISRGSTTCAHSPTPSAPSSTASMSW